MWKGREIMAMEERSGRRKGSCGVVVFGSLVDGVVCERDSGFVRCCIYTIPWEGGPSTPEIYVRSE